MIAYEVTRPVAASAMAAFDVIGTHVYDNHPRWESEVLEIRRLTDGPVGVGSRAVMVRKDFGRRSEVVYQCTEFEPDRRIAFDHVDSALSFHIAFTLTPTGPDSCECRVAVRARPRGALRLMTPLIRARMPRTGDRLTRQMAHVIEEQSASGSG